MSIEAISQASSANWFEQLLAKAQDAQGSDSTDLTKEIEGIAQDMGGGSFSDTLKSFLDKNEDGQIESDEISQAFEASANELMASLDSCHAKAMAFEINNK